MTFMNSMLKRASLYLAPVTLAAHLITPSAHALEKDQAKQALHDIYQATIHSYYSVNGFYNFSANQADKQHLNLLQDSTNRINDIMSSLQPVLDSGATADSFNSANDSWEKYQGILNQNIDEVNETGYTDLRLAGDMATSNIDLNASLDGLYNNVINSNEFKPKKITALSRDAAKTVALMMTKYSARTTSTVSQVYSGDDKEITIDSLANDFDQQITELAKLAEGNETAADLIESAHTKWNFIRNSYINYNENRVNFIVNLYSKKIINDIESAAGNL